jgi:hypothetical protein
MMPTKATTSESTYVIRDMNARALYLMEQGMNQEAAQELQEAMRYLRRYYDLSHHQRNWRHNTGTMSTAYDCSVQQLQATGKLGDCVPDFDPDACASQTTSTVASTNYSGIGGSNSIHDHAISLPQLQHSDVTYASAFCLPFSDETIASVEYCTQATTVILYNTALAIHRYGIQSGRSEALCQAAVSYNTVLALVGPNVFIIYPEIVVIILGIMCNLAHIHLEFRQLPEFLSARADLRYLMSMITLSKMTENDLAFFNLHLFCLDREDVCYAPAA